VPADGSTIMLFMTHRGGRFHLISTCVIGISLRFTHRHHRPGHAPASAQLRDPEQFIFRTERKSIMSNYNAIKLPKYYELIHTVSFDRLTGTIY
jgi:hypothetical protein